MGPPCAHLGVFAGISAPGSYSKPPPCTQGPEERWQQVPEGPQPTGEPLPNGGTGQDPLEQAYLLLLGQLNAVTEELARTREELRRSKASAEHEEKKPLDFLKRRVSPCPADMGLDGAVGAALTVPCCPGRTSLGCWGWAGARRRWRTMT